MPGVAVLSSLPRSQLCSRRGSFPSRAESAKLEASGLLLPPHPTPRLGLISAPATSHFGALPSPAPAPSSHRSFLATARFQPQLSWAWLEGVTLFCQSVPQLALPSACLRTTVWITELSGHGKDLGRLCSVLPPAYLWAWPLWTVCSLLLPHSVAGYPKPQHPGDRAQRCALPAC